MSALWELPSDGDVIVSHVPVEGRRVVDVGCGGGGLVRFLRAQGAQVTGVEVSADRLAGAIAADPGHADDYVVGAGQDLPFDAGSIDVVVFVYSLHHVPSGDMAGALQEAQRVLAPGGVLVIAEPILEGPGETAFLPIVDETEVRAQAQAVLDDRPASLTEVVNTRYETAFSYADAAEVEADMVGVDPDRRALWDDLGDDVIDALFSTSQEDAGRHWWPQPARLRIFERA